jgi:PAS domain S-box-containing protein
MEEYEKEISRIRTLLASHPEGMSITDISGSLQINRNSIAKYMDILQIRGAVDGCKRGTSKVYYLSERLLVTSIRKICSRPFLIINQDSLVVDVNAGFLQLAQAPANQILQQPYDTLPLKFVEDGGSHEKALKGAIRGIEQRVRGHVIQGTKVLPVSLLLVPIVFETGKPGVCLIVDESGENSGAKPADNQNTGLLALLDDQMEYIVRHTPEGIIWFANDTYCRAVGKAREELIGRPFKPLVSIEEAQRISLHLKSLTPQYPVGSIEYRAVMANGESRYLHWQDRALFNNRNEPVGYNSCGMDITDYTAVSQKLKKTQETLEESILNRTEDLRGINRQLYEEIARREKTEEQLQLTQFAMDNAGDMIFWISPDAHIQYANTHAVLVLGYPNQELHDQSFGIIAPAYPLDTWDIFWEELKRNKTVSAETALVKSDGSRFPAEIKFTYLEYHGREFVYCYIRDITERTRMERALQQANNKLNALTSIARHDIQNKITVLLGYLGRTKKATKDPVLLGYLDRQEQAAKSINAEINLTREFKDLGRQPPEWQDLNAIVRTAIENYRETGIDFVADLPGIEVYADVQIDRAFQRLLSATANDQNHVTTVRISLSNPGENLQIILNDDGPGVPPDQKERIFELQSDGTGMQSLFIAREILSLTDITLTENGDYGRGSRFVIEIPASYYRNILKTP